ncbi:MAG: type II toxin-antitoxin system VapC family toxin [Dehalococcoidia bacterium]
MSDALVLDASVAVKLVLDEALSETAHALVRDALLARRPIVAPPLLPSEVTNAVYQQERRKLISAREADEALRRFLALPVQLVALTDVFVEALAHARRHRLAATYDSQYIVVAERLDADLWTADATLIRSLPRSARRVRWIGDYVSSRGPSGD